MAFKMKQSPAKGKLGDFFKGVGKKITEGRQKRVDKQLESKKGTEYEGMTSMEAARAEKKSRKSGESKFQADSRRMGEKKRADKKANKAASSIKGEKDNAKPKQANTEIKTKPTPGTDYNYNMTDSNKDGSTNTPKTKLTFKKAFAAARKAGKKTFSFNGKSFTTELAETKKTDKKTKPGQVDLKTGNINVDYAKKKK
tara:strand:- start:39 stop:632 length:594 start_codon:yes stop_codon:yes gene_type:complete